MHFSQNTYEGVGVRDIAADAGVDPALVIRYFGSKEDLFRAIVAKAFGTEELLDGGVSELPDRAADLLLSDFEPQRWREGYEPLRLLLASIGSPVAGPILAEHLDASFVRPLVEAIGGPQAEARGTLLAAQVVGFALMRIVSAERFPKASKATAFRRLLVESARHLTAK